MKRILLAIGLVLGMSSVEAQLQDGNNLLDMFQECDRYDSGDDEANPMVCSFITGYVIGTIHGWERAAGVHKFPSQICVPANASFGQMTAVVRKYMDNTPEKLHLPASGIVLLALREAFPCE